MNAESPERLSVVEDYHVPLNIDSRNDTFLIKVPEWLGQQILNAPSGTFLGESESLASFRLHPSLAGDKPNVFNLKISQAIKPSETFLFAADSEVVTVGNISQAMHAIPTRSDAYRQISQARSAASAASGAERRTVIANRDLNVSPHGSVHMFKLANSSTPMSDSRRGVKPAILPHQVRAQASTSLAENLSSEELIMKLLVAEDIGWNLQNFLKKFKDAGGSGLNLVQMKSKLFEICDYGRRGEDSHPKYYLKMEYKTPS